MEFARMTWREIEELPHNSIFFLSLGPMEAHGPHLPVSTDFEIAKRVERETVKILERKGCKCISLPSLPIGSCSSLEGFTGTMSMRWKSVYNILYDYIKSVARYGFRYFVIVNFHMDILHLRGIYAAIGKLRKEGIKIVEPLSPSYFGGELFEDIKGEVHADVKETSLALHLFPEMVGNYHLEEMKIKFNLLNATKKFIDLGAKEAYVGNPSKANENYGKKLFQAMVNCCVDSALALQKGEMKDLPAKIKILLKI